MHVVTTPLSPADHDAVLQRLGTELATVARSVERIRGELGALRAAPEASAPRPPSSPSPQPQQSQQSQQSQQPFPSSPQPSRPPQSPPRPQSPTPPTPPGPWRPFPPATAPGAGSPRPWASSPSAPSAPSSRSAGAGLGARLLAATGAAVTLLGVVLLLVLAARGGWFGPGAQVVAGAALGLGLAVVGLRLRPRHATGATALVVTGVAALYLDVAAASALHAFLPVPAALALGLVVLGAGLVVADRWDSPGLAAGAVTGLAILVPVVAHRPVEASVLLLVVAQALAAVLAARRGWSVPVLVATLASVLAVMVAVVRLALRGATDPVIAPTTAGALASLAVGALLAVLAGARVPASTRTAVLVLGLGPVLLTGALHGRWWGVAVTGMPAVLLLLVAARARRRAAPDRTIAVVLEAMSAVAGLVATALAVAGEGPLAMLLLGQATVLAVVTLVTGRLGPLVAAAGYGAIALVATLSTVVPPDALAAYGDPRFVAPPDLPGHQPAFATVIVTSLLLVAAALTGLAALVRHVPQLGRDARRVAVAGLGVLALYGVTGAVVATAMLVSPTRTGFLTGHVLVTVSWTVVALILLVRGLRAARSAASTRILGGVLVVAAVAKLVLFDLVALDGLARVVAFLGAGLVLLAAGTRYASLVADSGGEPTPDGGPAEEPDGADTDPAAGGGAGTASAGR